MRSIPVVTLLALIPAAGCDEASEPVFSDSLDAVEPWEFLTRGSDLCDEEPCGSARSELADSALSMWAQCDSYDQICLRPIATRPLPTFEPFDLGERFALVVEVTRARGSGAIRACVSNRCAALLFDSLRDCPPDCEEASLDRPVTVTVSPEGLDDESGFFSSRFAAPDPPEAAEDRLELTLFADGIPGLLSTSELEIERIELFRLD